MQATSLPNDKQTELELILFESLDSDGDGVLDANELHEFHYYIVEARLEEIEDAADVYGGMGRDFFKEIIQYPVFEITANMYALEILIVCAT